MREQLTQYIQLLFAGSDGTEDIKTEILQNTLDRYDDLVAQGRTPEDAYRQAISGIGDINELLNGEYSGDAAQSQFYPNFAPDLDYERNSALVIRIIRAIAICMYILSPAPILLLEPLGWDEIGVALMLIIVALATGLLLIFRKKEKSSEENVEAAPAPQNPDARKKVTKSIDSLISTVGLVVYFLVSFKTMRWAVTWLIFPITAAIKGVVHALMDLKES